MKREMKNYETNLAECMGKYREMKEEYLAMTESPEYRDIAYSMSFEFLNASHICKSLQLYADMAKNGEKPKMDFASADDAIVFYKNIFHMKKKKEQLLEGANYVAEVSRLLDEINEFATQTPYLGKSFCLQGDDKLFQLAKQCIEEIPQYKTNMTKNFRYCFLESAIECSKKEEVSLLVDAKVIIAEDLDNIMLSGSKEYEDKIAILCDQLGHNKPLVEKHEVNLTGVTFTNDNGTSRQEMLSRMKQDASEGKELPLIAEPYIFIPEIGEPRQAVRILWDGNILGTLAQDVVNDIYGKYENPQLTVKLREVTGGTNNKGRNINYGCRVEFGVVAPKYKDQEPKEEEKVFEKPDKEAGR